MLKDVISKLTVLTISEAFLFSLIALCKRRKKMEKKKKMSVRILRACMLYSN